MNAPLLIRVVPALVGLACGSVFAGPEHSPKPEVDVSYETRSRTPKFAGVAELSLSPPPPDHEPVFYRTQTFSGERHLAQGAYWPMGAFSPVALQKREKISGRIRHVYNPATDLIAIVNDSLHEVAGVSVAPWSADIGPFPEPPVLTVAVEPLSPVAPIGPVGQSNPLNLTVRDAVTAMDDDAFGHSVGGLVGISAYEFQNSYKMTLSEPETVAEAESRARVTVVADVSNPGSRTAIRGTRKGGAQWPIREVTVRYRLRGCAGVYALVKTFRKRLVNYQPSLPAQPWLETWTEREAVTLESESGPAMQFELPLIDEHEVELVSLQVLSLADCITCGAAATAGGMNGPVNGSIRWVIPLGLKSDGQSVGGIVLQQPSITSVVYSPAALEPALDAEDGTVIPDAAGRPRQLLVPQALVDVVTTAPQAFELRFYPRDLAGPLSPEGVHLPAGSPYLVWRIENPDGTGATTDRLRVTRISGSDSVVTEVDETQPNRRIFSEAGGLRVTETLTSTAGANRVETVIVRDASGTVASKREVHYQPFVWGEERVKEVLDPDGAALTTQWTYETNTSDPAFRQVIAIVRPDGSTEDFRYDGARRRWARVTPAWITDRQTDSNQLQFVDLDGDGLLDQLTTLRTQIRQSIMRLEYTVDWAGTALGFRRRDRFVARDGAALWNNPANIVTKERYHLEYGSLIYRLNPDGQLALFSQLSNQDGTTTKIARHGAADAALETVVDGTETTERFSTGGMLLSRVVTDIASELVLESMHVTATDELGRPTSLQHHDGAMETREYCAPCGQVASTTLRGVTTHWEYDGLGRKIEETQIAGDTLLARTRFGYDAEGRLLQQIRVDLESGAETVLATTVYDLAGRVVAESSLAHGTTTRGYAFGSQSRNITTITTADGATTIETRGAGGALLSVRGTAVAPVDTERVTKTSWGGGNGYFLETRKLNDNGSAVLERHSFDLLGNLEFREFTLPTNARFSRFYDRIGRLVREVDPDGVTILHAYDHRGRLATTAIDLNRNGVIDYAGTDRITRTTAGVAVRDGFTVRRASTAVWETDHLDVPTTVAIEETAVDGAHAWHTSRGLLTTTTHTFDGAGGATMTVTSPDGVVSVGSYLVDRLLASTVRAGDGAVLANTSYTYDSAGRLAASTDFRRGITSFGYDDADRLNSIVTPDPDPGRSGPGYDPQNTTYRHDVMGRVVATTLPDGGEVFTSYHPGGQVKRVWGSSSYPVEYAYDVQHRPKTMTTWQDFAGDTGRAVTTWNYDNHRGWLLKKSHANQLGPVQLYTPAGRVARYAWARDITVPYHDVFYNPAGDVARIDYPDATPDVLYTYDRLGRPRTIQDGSGTRTLAYDASGSLASETYGPGLLEGVVIARHYDPLQRLERVTASQGLEIGSTTYSYDAGSRLHTVGEGAHDATYTYGDASSLVAAVVRSRAGVARLATSIAYDRLNRVTSVAHGGNGQPDWIRRTYDYDAANQRTRIGHEDGTHWSFGFDGFGQLAGGTRHDAGGAPLPGHDYAWTYDDIGNRRTATANGHASAYVTNPVNAYSQRTVPGVIDVLGVAAPDATVTVTAPPGLPAPLAVERRGATFYRQVPVDNAAATRRQAVTVTGVKNFVGPAGEDAIATETRHALVPATPEMFTYDLDGNLTGDGRRAYSWDGQNRLIGMETGTLAAAAGEPRLRLVFTYDSQHRRVAKQVWRWTNSTWVLASSTRFVYDGWNMIAELDGLNGNAPLRTYLWGLDVSGSLQGAGGVGGLLAVTDHTAPAADPVTYFAASDGNGNVIGLVRAMDGAPAARYAYNPFGELMAAEGEFAASNPFRFSTKFTDSETGHLYYGLRYYSPDTGRWLNRDPIGEAGGANLYGFVGNSPVDGIDVLGLAGYFFDGTGNHARSGTNVRILHDVYSDLTYYYAGVGSSIGTRVVGGLTGAGGGNRLEAAYRNFIEAVDAGDRVVDIVGFSRGASLGREFANLLVSRGYDPAYGGKLQHRMKVVPASGSNPPGECEIVIRFVGLFDTVGSFGLPGNDINLGIRMHLPPQVARAAHATARDEQRYLFPLTPIDARDGFETRSFPGDHSDIGRGHGPKSNDLSRAPLEFVWQSGRAVGVPFGELPQFIPTGDATPHDLSRRFPYNLFPKRPR